MAKVIKNPVEIRLVKQNGEYDVSAHYGLSCGEYPELAIRKGIPITLSPQTLNDIDEEAMAQINAHEGIGA